MEPGEVWWARFDVQRPVVLLSGGAGVGFRAVRIVEPATPTQQVGFVLMSGEQAVDDEERRRVVAEAPPGTRAVGIEVVVGVEGGPAELGVVRVALPQGDMIFCTWTTTVGPDDLLERIGVLSAEKRHELDVALQLSGLDTNR